MVAETVASRFEVDALERDPSSIAAIGPEGRIGWVNDGWLQFARANGGARAAVQVGDNYFAGIGGEVRPLFAAAVAECLASGAPFEQDYECSSANEHRAFHLRMLPLTGNCALLVHSLVAVGSHDRIAEPPEEARYRNENGFITHCSNCRRTRSVPEGSWHWVPAWVEMLPEAITHVLCPVCRGFYWPRPRRLAEAASRKARRILIVDDDSEFCEVLAEVLNDQGFESSTCTNADQALELLRESTFQALLTDAVMPGVSGLELVKRARSLDSRLRCVIFSGHERPEGVDLPWIRKPVDLAAVVTALTDDNPART